jgi:hypothetical protein
LRFEENLNSPSWHSFILVHPKFETIRQNEFGGRERAQIITISEDFRKILASEVEKPPLTLATCAKFLSREDSYDELEVVSVMEHA